MDKFRYSEEERAFLEKSDVPYAIYQFINKRVITIVLSQGFIDLFGYSDMEKQDVYDLMDNNMYRDTHPDDMATLGDAAYRFATEGSSYDVIYRTKRDGRYRIIHAYGRHIYKENDVRLAFVWYTDQGEYTDRMLIFRNNRADLPDFLVHQLTERSRTSRMEHDYLTGLPTMTYFFDLAEAGCREIREKGKVPAILYMDFVGMKAFNQKFGMEGGDRFLKIFADRIITLFSHENCSRFSADHFCVYTDVESAKENAEILIAENEEKEKGRYMPLRIGFYTYDDETISISGACDRAKIACDSMRRNYKSKIYPFDKEMLVEIEKKQFIIDNLDRAIRERQIEVYYQPIIRTANGKVCCEETLSRWKDPEKGVLSPGIFVPTLEETNSSYKLDLYVLENVLQKMKVQADNGLYVVPQSLNLSRSDFYACDIVEEIRRRVDESGIERDKVIIEITESALADDVEYMTEEIKRLKRLGFPVWMDDYGSGYSSPSLLQTIPFDLIKIDMLFVRQLEEEERSKIIVTEIARMALSLGMDTIAEGVETKAQADFLKDIGCTMLQGYYFCRPVSLEQLLERYRTNRQIGFENPAEAGYYAQLGRINLYNLSMEDSEDESLKNYFDTWPMIIVECKGEHMSVVRCNETFRSFIQENFPSTYGRTDFDVSEYPNRAGAYSLNAVFRCAKDGVRTIIDDRTSDGKNIQLLIRRAAINPVTGVAAVIVVVLSATEGTGEKNGLTYNYIARVLSEDYIYLYFINMDTGEFTEYSPNGQNRDVSIERRGKDFFRESYEVAKDMIYKEDLEMFLQEFTREKIEQGLREHGSFTLTYRNMIDGTPVYVNMKIVKTRGKGNNVILGINNVDAQMRQQQALERIREEKMSFSRIAALSGEVMAIYSVDPETDEYLQYDSSEEYDTVGIVTQGEDFYEQTKINGRSVIYRDDQEEFFEQFNKENILRKIREEGMFTIGYRLMIQGRPMHMLLKATILHENGKDKIIIGVINVDDEVRRKEEYAMALSAMRAEANKDELTGVKRKNAYLNMEEQLNRQIEEERDLKFAVVVFDINELKRINDTLGHQAGDRYIMDGCEMICRTFKRSPVFRMGGDEFAVIAQGEDYDNIDILMGMIAKLNHEHHLENQVVVAAGMARHQPGEKVADVFRKADRKMYENKRALKSDM
ncbi:MAG: EAL domain-containing protein [Bacillota bacterium]|nr:EAL domain-containing protein [Bacillota bacterium]